MLSLKPKLICIQHKSTIKFKNEKQLNKLLKINKEKDVYIIDKNDNIKLIQKEFTDYDFIFSS